MLIQTKQKQWKKEFTLLITIGSGILNISKSSSVIHEKILIYNGSSDKYHKCRSSLVSITD